VKKPPRLGEWKTNTRLVGIQTQKRARQQRDSSRAVRPIKARDKYNTKQRDTSCVALKQATQARGGSTTIVALQEARAKREAAAQQE
jgi:hypothetical protein